MSALCHRCGIRWIQSWRGAWAGLCRSCARETGTLTTPDVKIARQQLTRREQRMLGSKVQDTEPRPTQEKVINGEVFEVVWDGS